MLENCYQSGVFKMYMLVDLCKTPPSFTFSLPLRAEMGKGNVWKLISFLSAFLSFGVQSLSKRIVLGCVNWPLQPEAARTRDHAT